MKVNLVAVTRPFPNNVSTNGEMTIEEFVAYVARVSNPSNQDNKTTAKKLLRYLRKNKHWSPFEMVHVVMEINTTRDIARQILRHASFRFQEFSQRYADPTQMQFVIREARLQDPKNRQNSTKTNDVRLKKEWETRQQRIIDAAKEEYKWAIDNGIAKEQARVVLPEGLTASRMYMAGSLRSWIHYCLLRMANGTQDEHMEIAKACWKIILELCPSLVEENDKSDDK